MTNNKKQNLKIFGMVLGFLWLIIINLGIIMAVKSFFECDTTDEIKLASKDCNPTFKVVYKGGNNIEKSLLPIGVPNWDEKEYTHLTEINYEGQLNLKKLQTVIQGNLFIKINSQVVVNNGAVNDLFRWKTTVNNIVLNDDNKAKISKHDGAITIPIKIEIERLQYFENMDVIKADFKTIYDIVDQNGNFFKSVESKINVAS